MLNRTPTGAVSAAPSAMSADLRNNTRSSIFVQQTAWHWTFVHVAVAMPACVMHRVCFEAIRALRHKALSGPSYLTFKNDLKMTKNDCLGPAIGLGLKHSVAWIGAFAFISSR